MKFIWKEILCCKHIVFWGNLTTVDKKGITQGFIINLKSNVHRYELLFEALQYKT